MAELNFPFPEKFTTEQWRFLLSLNGDYCMARYMFNIANKIDDDPKQLGKYFLPDPGPNHLLL